MAAEDQGQMDVAVLQRTQEILGSIIKKPPLTDKLLRKPPFKFLHDIITNVINATGFMSGVFTGDELDGDNIKDRDTKIAFLQKAMDHVASTTGESLKMRPSKTVAGHEADRTNEFLQAMGRAASKEKEHPKEKEKSPSKTSSRKTDKRPVAKSEDSKKRHKTVEESAKASVGKAKTSGETRAEKWKTDEKRSERSKANERKSDKSKVDERRSEKLKATAVPDASLSRERTRNQKDGDRSMGGRGDPAKKRSTSRDVPADKSSSSRSKGAVVESTYKEAARSERRRSSVDEVDSNVKNRRPSVATKSRNDVNRKVVDKVPAKKVANEDDADEAIAEINKAVTHDAQSVATSEVVPEESKEVAINGSSREIRSSAHPRTGRLGTATLSSNDTAAAAPEIALTDDYSSLPEQQQQQQQELVKRPSTSTIRRSSARPPTARPAAPRVRVVETAPEDDALSQAAYPVTNVIMDGDTNRDGDDETFVIEEPPIASDPTVTNHVQAEDFVGAPHGSLVAQILETKRDLETGSERPTTGHRRVEIDDRLVLDAARRKERESVAREMDGLREGVQTLTRGANPLGKLVGYHEEDVESMLRELDAWTAECRQLEAELRTRQSEADPELERLKREMREVEESIDDWLAKTSVVKVNVIRNDERIRRMVSGSDA